MRRTITSTVVAAALILAVQRPALASDEEADQRWYGAPIIFTDVTSDCLLVLFPPLGAAGISLGAPLIHLGHGRRWTALASLGLRLTAEVVGLYLLLRNADCYECDSGSPLIAVAPLLAVQALDASLLAWTTPETRRPTVAASMRLSHQGATFGVGGRF